MGSLILASGIDSCCYGRINSRFGSGGNRIIQCSKTDDIQKIISRKRPDLFILGCQSQIFNNELSLIRKIKSLDGRLPIILINRYSSEERAVEAFRAGVNDYFRMPLPYDQLFKSISSNLGLGSESAASAGDTEAVTPRIMIGENDTMLKIKAHLIRVAVSHSTVLITGETGTGKELAATLIHQHSRRSSGPFISVNCAALPDNLVESELYGHKRGAFTGAFGTKKGKFELASGGTLFMDEIGDMSLFSQAKILRSIENKEVYPLGAHSALPIDLRIIAATNQDPETLIEKGRFRKDLFYRLNVARIHMPPLRERKDDIPRLVAMNIDKLNAQFNRHITGLSHEAMASLYQHNWHGNVRELSNTIEAAFINCSKNTIAFTDLPPNLAKKLQYTDNTSGDERDRLLIALTKTNWNKTKAAKKLKWSRMRVYRSLERYNIKPPK